MFVCESLIFKHSAVLGRTSVKYNNWGGVIIMITRIKWVIVHFQVISWYSYFKNDIVIFLLGFGSFDCLTLSFVPLVLMPSEPRNSDWIVCLSLLACVESTLQQEESLFFGVGYFSSVAEV